MLFMLTKSIIHTSKIHYITQKIRMIFIVTKKNYQYITKSAIQDYELKSYIHNYEIYLLIIMQE